jgi:hypothetical protein
MMPFFPLYGALTHQVFAHTYMGSHRHAFTVGFISMMILGVSARVVPILAGVDAKRMNSLRAPFAWWHRAMAHDESSRESPADIDAHAISSSGPLA